MTSLQIVLHCLSWTIPVPFSFSSAQDICIEQCLIQTKIYLAIHVDDYGSEKINPMNREFSEFYGLSGCENFGCCNTVDCKT